MFKLLPESKYLSEMLCILIEHSLVIYVQIMRGFRKKKPLSLQEKSFENDSIHIVSDSILKRLKFDYSFSETVSNQKIKFRTIFLVIAYPWRSD